MKQLKHFLTSLILVFWGLFIERFGLFVKYIINQNVSALFPGWPEKICQMSIKVAQKWFH